MAETDQRIYVENPEGAENLVTSLKLYVKKPGSSTYVKIGTALRVDTREDRDMLYSYVIGNKDSATARDLIPGVIRSSTMEMEAVSLYISNIIAALGDTEGMNWISSIRYQTRPFLMKEQIVHPNTNKVREIVYEGCMMSDYSKRQSMDTNDIRVIESITIHFKSVKTITDQINADD